MGERLTVKSITCMYTITVSFSIPLADEHKHDNFII